MNLDTGHICLFKQYELRKLCEEYVPISEDESVFGPIDSSLNDELDNASFKTHFVFELSKTATSCSRIILCGSLYFYEDKKFSLSQSRGISISLVDDTGMHLCDCYVDLSQSGSLALEIVEFKKDNDGDWSFNVVNCQYKDGLPELIERYA